jgi:hypothetical protein
MGGLSSGVRTESWVCERPNYHNNCDPRNQQLRTAEMASYDNEYCAAMRRGTARRSDHARLMIATTRPVITSSRLRSDRFLTSVPAFQNIASTRSRNNRVAGRQQQSDSSPDQLTSVTRLARHKAQVAPCYGTPPTSGFCSASALHGDVNGPPTTALAFHFTR